MHMFLFATRMFLFIQCVQLVTTENPSKAQLNLATVSLFSLNNFLSSQTISEGLESRCSLKVALYFPTYQFCYKNCSHFLYLLPSLHTPHTTPAICILWCNFKRVLYIYITIHFFFSHLSLSVSTRGSVQHQLFQGREGVSAMSRRQQ